MQPTLLLVHGGFHGAWCWDGAIKAFEERGRRAVAVDLPGHGDDKTPFAEITLAGYVERVIAAIDAESGAVTLVGHSMGGVPITLAADRRRNHVAALIYVAALIPVAGESLVDITRNAPSESLGGVVYPSDDGLSMRIDPAAATEFFYHDCQPAAVAAAVARLQPEPLRPLLDPSPPFSVVAPAGYVTTLQDRSAPLAMQRMFVDRIAGMKTTEIEGSHSPFVARPAAFADALLDLEARLTESSGR